MFTKYSFPLTHLFLCYQTLENTENYLYRRFSIKTNGATYCVVQLVPLVMAKLRERYFENSYICKIYIYI